MSATSVSTTSDVAAVTGGGTLLSVSLTPAAAVATLTVYDNTAASGTILCTLQAAANGSSAQRVFTCGVIFNTGIYLDIGGAGASADIEYVGG